MLEWYLSVCSVPDRQEDKSWEALLGVAQQRRGKGLGREGRVKWEAVSLADCRVFYRNWFPEPHLEVGSLMPISQSSKLRPSEARGLDQKLSGEIRIVLREGQLTDC